MNNSTITGVVVAVVLLAALAYVLVQTQWFTVPFSIAPAAEQQETETEEEVTNTVPDKGTGTLSTVLGRGGNYTCALQFSDPKLQTTATIYGADRKVREDFRTVDAASGKITTTHMIKNGGLVYTWVDGAIQGTKVSSTVAGGPKVPALSGGGFIGDEDLTVGWDCHAWLPDMKYFDPPKEIIFVAS